MSLGTPQDELLKRYEEAKAALPDGLPDQPSAALHGRILVAAREQVNAINKIALHADSMPTSGLKSFENTQARQTEAPEAANDSFWNIRALGSLAVMGLAGLLWWQFEHGTPEEREATSSATPSAAVVAAATAPAVAPPPALAAMPPTPAPATTLETVPSSAPASAKSALPSAPQVASNAMRKEAPISASSKPSEAKITSVDIAAAPSAAPMPAPAPEAARARMQEAAPTIAPAPAPAVAPVARSSPQTEKAIADTSTSGIQYAAPTASAPAAVATAPRVLAAPAPAARALIASPDKLFQAIEAKDDAALRQTLSQGASPNANASARPDGNPALTQAVMQRWADGVRILLAAGANREAKNKKGHTAADVALELGYSDMAELLAISR